MRHAPCAWLRCAFQARYPARARPQPPRDLTDKRCYLSSGKRDEAVMSDVVPVAVPMAPAAPMPTQASSDAEVIELWLHGRSPHTQRAYQGDLDAFRAYCPKPLRQ